MAIIVGVETSTKICSVAIHREGTLLANIDLHLERSHSSYLAKAINDLIFFCELSLQQIDAFAIAKGPGSYTGLRIGTSTIKGLCYGLDKPMIAINTLEAMAAGAMGINTTGAYLCPMIDARRMEVYCLLVNDEKKIVQETTAKIIEKESFEEELTKSKIIFFGDGAAKCKKVLGENSNAVFIDSFYPSAIHMGGIALEKFKDSLFEDIAYFEPFYLKEYKAGKPKQLK